MKKKKIKVAVVYNEATPEMYVKSSGDIEKVGEFKPYFEVEDLTPMEEYEILAIKLSRVGFDAYALNIKDNIQKMIDDFKNNKPDVVFNFIEIYKEDSRLEMNVVGIYELLGVAYTGAPAMALSNCQNKIMAKQLLRSLGVPIPNYFMVNEKRERYLHKLDYPLVVKPSLEDASVGIENESIVKNYKKLKERVNYVLHYFEQPVLVEEFIDGRELNIAVLGDKKLRALPISEIDFSRMPDHLHNIVSYQAKWDPHHESYHKTIPECPAILPKNMELKAKEIALKAFRIMGCRDYARVDMRLNKNNQLRVLEVNPNPDLTEGAGFMRSAGAAGYSYAQALKRIVMLAYARNNGKHPG